MNERIKELIEQADFEENDGHISIQGVYMFNTTRMEKFAELIVRECAELFEVEWGEEKLTGNDVGYVVKKHFGVEE